MLAQFLPVKTLEQMTHEIGLSGTIAISNDLLGGRLRGRTVVAVDRWARQDNACIPH